MMSKKRKLSGMGGPELLSAYNTLLQLKNTLTEGEDEDFEQGMSKMRRLMKSELLAPQRMTMTMLEEKHNVVFVGELHLKPDHAARTERSKRLGQDAHMSAENMQRHLSMLDTLVPLTSDASARPWIDTLFFRAGAMVPTDKRMILKIDPSPVMTPAYPMATGGKINYTAILADKQNAEITFHVPLPHRYRHLPTAFVVTGGPLEGVFADHLPLACADIYAWAKSMQKPIIRGAVTNGLEWFFIIMHLNQDSCGATYKHSLPLALRASTTRIDPCGPSLIAGVLASWIEHGSEGLGEDDWFEELN
ncbi:hypothetical protein FB451DRAFT_1256667 [Mycena latifolia]|nr:hypothetical protein FB451DRAFT_1256667 [Mycena latifolia]